MSDSRLIKLASLVLVLIVVVTVAVLLMQGGAEEGVSYSTEYDFGEVVQGEVVEHDFVLGNDETSDLVIAHVTPRFSQVVSLDSVLPASSEGRIRLALDTRDMRGTVKESIKVEFTNENQAAVFLHLRGRVVLPVQVVPHDHAYFFNVVKGQSPSATLELINHREEPLAVLSVESSDPIYQTNLDTIEAGRLFNLTVALDSETPPGEHRGTVTVRTNSPEFPLIEIATRAKVKDIVSASPARVHYSRVMYEGLQTEPIYRKTVAIEKHQGTDFEIVDVTADIPFLDIEIETKNPGQSYLVHVDIVQERAPRGVIDGTLVIETNDPDFPRLELPITGEIV